MQQWIDHSTASLIRISRTIDIPDSCMSRISLATVPPCRPAPRSAPSSRGPGGCSRWSPRRSSVDPRRCTRAACPRCGRWPRWACFAGDDQTFIVYGDRTYGFGTFVADRQRRGRRPPRSLRARQGRPGGRALPEQPGVVPRLLGHRPAGRHPRGPQRLVDHRRDLLRLAGLRRQGAGGRPEALRADRRPRSTDAPDLEHVFLVDCSPGRPGPGGRSPPAHLRRAHPAPPPPTSWTRTSPRTTPRSSSTPRAPPADRRAPSPPTGA